MKAAKKKPAPVHDDAAEEQDLDYLLARLADAFGRLGRRQGCDSVAYQRWVMLLLAHAESADELRARHRITTSCAEHAGGPCSKHAEGGAA